MRMVQVGVLGMGKWWVQVGLKSPDVEVAGYVDINPDHLKAIQDEFDIAPSQCFVDFDEALKELKPDAVLIVTPPQFHEPIAVKAMEAGCHVLTEKPLADTWEACLRTVEAVRRTGRIMMVAQNYRYRPEIQTLRNTLRSGRFGAPGQVLIHFTRGPHFGGFREEMPYPLIIDMSIHHYDLMRYILDADPVRLTAFSWNPAVELVPGRRLVGEPDRHDPPREAWLQRRPTSDPRHLPRQLVHPGRDDPLERELDDLLRKRLPGDDRQPDLCPGLGRLGQGADPHRAHGPHRPGLSFAGLLRGRARRPPARDQRGG